LKEVSDNFKQKKTKEKYAKDQQSASQN
jgi:hypothetical protein